MFRVRSLCYKLGALVSLPVIVGWSISHVPSSRYHHHHHHQKRCWSLRSTPSSTGDPKKNIDQSEHLGILDRNLARHSDRGFRERMKITGDNNNNNNDDDDEDDGCWDDNVHMSTRFALLSHGHENGLDGPIHNYANFGACGAFQLPREALLQVPAARVASPGVDQQTWSMILQRLRIDPDNVLEDYQGYRSTLRDGRRFYIRDAVVWNCYTDTGEYYGQALLFDRQKVSFAD